VDQEQQEGHHCHSSPNKAKRKKRKRKPKVHLDPAVQRQIDATYPLGNCDKKERAKATRQAREVVFKAENGGQSKDQVAAEKFRDENGGRTKWQVEYNSAEQQAERQKFRDENDGLSKCQIEATSAEKRKKEAEERAVHRAVREKQKAAERAVQETRWEEEQAAREKKKAEEQATREKKKAKQRFPQTDVTNRIVSSCHGFLMQGTFVWTSEEDLQFLVALARDRRNSPEDNSMQGADQKVKDKFTAAIKVFYQLMFVVRSEFTISYRMSQIEKSYQRNSNRTRTRIGYVCKPMASAIVNRVCVCVCAIIIGYRL